MITFITDRWERPDGTLEPDILAGREMERLSIVTLEGNMLVEIWPTAPWTHERLEALNPGLEALFGDILRSVGADGFLGDKGVGSTEV